MNANLKKEIEELKSQRQRNITQLFIEYTREPMLKGTHLIQANDDGWTSTLRITVGYNPGKGKPRSTYFRIENGHGGIWVADKQVARKALTKPLERVLLWPTSRNKEIKEILRDQEQTDELLEIVQMIVIADCPEMTMLG